MAVKTKHRFIKPSFKLGSGGKALAQWIARHEPHSAVNGIPLAWKRARDFSVWDVDGNKFIDLTSGIFVTNAGHANPAIARAIRKQLSEESVFAYNYPTDIKHRFMKKLLSLSPSHFNAMTLLNSGSEAMDTVYKLIKLYGKKAGKKYIVVFKGSYHGRGLSNDLISGNKERASWSNVKDPAVIFIDFPYEKDASFDPATLPPAKEIAGFILETFQGWGAWFYPRAYVQDLISFAKKHKILVAFDEMQSGSYRLGPIYGYQTYGRNLRPDIIALGKGISSSLPLSVVLSRKELFDLDTKADLHGTHSGNALVMAAGLANLEFLSSKKELTRRAKTVSLFEREMSSLGNSPLVTHVNARGLIAGIIFKDAGAATAVVKRCIAKGVLPVCTYRNAIKIAPPLTITSGALKEAAGVIHDALAAEAS